MGRKHTEESKKKISLAKMGSVAWNKGTKGLSKSNSGSFKKGQKSPCGMLGKKHSEETLRKMSVSWARHRTLPPTRYGKDSFLYGIDRSGPNHPNWISDRTKIVGRHNRSFHDSDYSYWSKAVKNRDGWKCKISNGACSGRLESHHILGWKDYPELRYKLNNGITLCHAHHPRVRAEEKRLIPTFQELVSVSKK